MNDAFERAAEKEAAEHRRGRHERHARGKKKGFSIHLTVFVAVQLLLVVVWAIQWELGGTGHPWFVYALLGWGIGLAAHWAAIRGA